MSQLTLGRFLKWSRVVQPRCQVIPNTYDATRFSPGSRSKELSRRYGLAFSKEQAVCLQLPRSRVDSPAVNRVILTVARLVASERYKGIDEVLEVFPALLNRHPDLVYLIVGDGDDRARLQDRAKALGIAESVRFAGWIDEDEKAAHYRLADAFVMPGHGEGFGIVYLEAMACGVPVVGSMLDGSREALRNGKLGVLVDPDNPADLIAGIEAALDRPRRVPSGLGVFGFGEFVEKIRSVVIKQETVSPDLQ